MGVDKNTMLTAGASVLAGLGGAALGGPVGGVAAAGAAGTATHTYLSSDSGSDDE